MLINWSVVENFIISHCYTITCDLNSLCIPSVSERRVGPMIQARTLESPTNTEPVRLHWYRPYCTWCVWSHISRGFVGGPLDKDRSQTMPESLFSTPSSPTQLFPYSIYNNIGYCLPLNPKASRRRPFRTTVCTCHHISYIYVIGVNKILQMIGLGKGST